MTDSDIAWLCSLKEDGHCGEGSLELKGRTARNDRIDRILSALSTSSARVVELEKQIELMLCEDCPPVGYPTDKMRCEPCPRRSALHPEGSGRDPKL